DGVLGSNATADNWGCPDRSPLLTLTGITDQVAPPSVLLTGPRLVAPRIVDAACRPPAQANSRQPYTSRFRVSLQCMFSPSAACAAQSSRLIAVIVSPQTR